MEQWPGTVLTTLQASPAPDNPRPQSDAPLWPGQVIASSPKQEGFFSRVGKAVTSAVTGEGRKEFDFPDLSSQAAPIDVNAPWFSDAREAQLQKSMTFDRLGLARTDKGKLDILAKEFPDIASTAKADKFGNVYVAMGGKQYYLNRPGVSREDFSEAQAGLVSTLPPTLLTGGAYAGASLPARMAMSGGVGASGSVVQDLLAQQFGSTEKIDPGMALASGAAGAAFEGLQPAARAIYQQIVRRPELYNQSTGTLTDAGRSILARVGFAPEEVSDDFARQFANMARQAANPEDAARLAAAQSLPVPVNPTLGDATRNPSQQMFESLAEKGAYGETAGAIIRNARSGQQEALRANVPAIQERIGGGQVTERGQAGQAVQQTLVNARNAERQAVDSAYNAARATNAELATPEAVNEFYTGVIQAAGPRFRHSPMAQDMAGQLQELMRRNPSLTELYNWRRDLSSLAQGANPVEKGALDAMRRHFDATMSDFALVGYISGDEGAVQAWNAAIRARADFGAKWESGNILEKLTETVGQGQARQLKVAPEAASNVVFGGTSNGFLTQPEAVRVMRNLQQNLPPEQWNAIREEAFLRIAQNAEGAYQGAERSFSGVNLIKSWQNFQTKNPALARLMFNDEERRLIGQFTRVAADVTGKVRGGDNFSNTTPAMANIVQRLPFLNRTLQLVVQMPGVRSLVNAGQTVRAAGAVNPSVPRLNVPGAGVAGEITGPTIDENLP